MKGPLLIPDQDRLGRKLANPPPLLAKLYQRFRERIDHDAKFRQHNIFLPALLGEPAAIAEAKELILQLAAQPLLLAADRLSDAAAQNRLDAHIWCVAPRAMRLAVYFTWLDAHGAWTPDERAKVAGEIVDFFYAYVIPVLRGRTPAGHNQQLSMTLCSAVAGHAFATEQAVAIRARALETYAMPKLYQTLGLIPPSGYSGEGSTYQSDVVSPLVMWAGIFLDQLGESEVWTRKWLPREASLADVLRMEAISASCGGLLPPWDNYGWSHLHNLAARALYAVLTGENQVLKAAETAWDEHGSIAWRPDDRMWTLIYWPEESSSSVGWGVQPVGIQPPTCNIQTQMERQGHSQFRVRGVPARSGTSGSDVPGLPTSAGLRMYEGTKDQGTKDHASRSPVLSGWSLPSVGAAIEHLPTRLRVMAAWDRCSGGLQGIGRHQANPNHLMVELAGEPITADGYDGGLAPLYSEASTERTLNALSEIERQLVAQQYGSLDKWVGQTQQGFLGASCAIVVDRWDSYFPRAGWQGRLICEERTPERHTFAADSASFYRPAFDVTQMRRTVSVGISGLIWVVDDIRAGSEHGFTWRAWLRRGIVQEDPLRLRLCLPSGVEMTMAWFMEGNGTEVAAAVTLHDTPAFPFGRKGLCWPDQGSIRCDLETNGRRVRIVTCMVPHAAAGLRLRSVSGSLEAIWEGGAEVFEMSSLVAEASEMEAPGIFEPEELCDLDEAPFALSEESNDKLLAVLEAAPVKAWRETAAAMQTLTVRGCRAAMPRIVALLQDARQNYTVHSVAAWCLGHARYRPALEVLGRMSEIPEVNTALRAGWAVERMDPGHRRMSSIGFRAVRTAP